MKTRIMFLIGIATTVLGCATTQVRDDQFAYVRMASYSSPVNAQDSGWFGAITVHPEQIFED
jgi:hypothetical protein